VDGDPPHAAHPIDRPQCVGREAPPINPLAVSVEGCGGGVGQNPGSVPTDALRCGAHDPAFRDPRGYIIPVDQDDFPTAVKPHHVLLKGGWRFISDRFMHGGGQDLSGGSYVVKSDQAYRPSCSIPFEPTFHPILHSSSPVVPQASV